VEYEGIGAVRNYVLAVKPGKFLRRPGRISGKVLALQRRIECSALERLLLLIRPPQGDLFGVYLCRTSCFNGPRL